MGQSPVKVWSNGTGFHAADYLRSLNVYETGGRRLRDEWRDGAEAYLGTVIPGYPNLFTLASAAISGTYWMALAPVPIDATRSPAVDLEWSQFDE